MEEIVYLDDNATEELLEFWRTTGRYEVFRFIGNGQLSTIMFKGHTWKIHTEKSGEQIVGVFRADDVKVRVNPVHFVKSLLNTRWREKMLEKVPQARQEHWRQTGENDLPVNFWMRINNWDLQVEHNQGPPEELRILSADWIDPY